ncbi:hypothetical protein SAMN05421874_107255 [Nonomuraea maritima]|uniref:Secreted protein n=1 Tax=Nonomuraea maritima TaxID=683260 RepID=A0A1G9BRE6_9ACTN|nr:hypothetical protein [Nonomuraea maritima]SDK41744.1 hypothetical protein SAMN05421874_107255 [Nonomuraea maritima]
MKARQIGAASAAAIALLTSGAIIGSSPAMADDRQTPRLNICSTGPVYRSAYVRVDVRCTLRIERVPNDTADELVQSPEFDPLT